MYVEDARLNQLLADPLIQLVMKSDGVVEADLISLAQRVAGRLRGSVAGPSPSGLARLACCNALPA